MNGVKRIYACFAVLLMWLLTSIKADATPQWFKTITPKKTVQRPIIFVGNKEEQKMRDEQCKTSDFFFIPKDSNFAYRCSDNTHGGPGSHWSHLSHYSQYNMN